MYKDNWGLIQNFERTQGKHINFFNFRIKDNNLEQVVDKPSFNRIYESQGYTFKITCSLGLILFNKDENCIYYFYASDRNSSLLDDIFLIKNARDFTNFKKRIREIDPTNFIREEYHTILLRVTNICFFVYKTNIPLNGYLCGCDFPAKIKRNKNLVVFTQYVKHCFFRCLAYHNLIQKKTYDISSDKIVFGKETRSLLSKFKSKFGDKDVTLSIMKKIELLFKVKINIYTFEENDNLKCIYNTVTDMPGSTLRLLLTTCPQHPYSHVSYIKNWSFFSKSFSCESCGTLFSHAKYLKAHYKRVTSCNVVTSVWYSRGVFKPYTDVWDLLRNKFNIYFETTPQNNFFAVFDFEAMLITTNICTQQTTYTQRHTPICYSICSNVPGFIKPLCIIKTTSEQELINGFVDKLEQISDAAYSLSLEKYKHEINTISQVCDTETLEKVLQCFRVLPVISFNGKSYDIPIIRRFLFTRLKSPFFVIKQNNNYLTVKTSKLQFLDITTYIAPNTSYSAFLDALQIPIKKGFFPYSYLTSEKVLQETNLPAKEHFFNDLTSEPLSDENYNLCLKAWKDNKMKTFRDYLIYYNNLDTYPFVLAVEKMIDLFKVKNISIFKDAISLPGVSQKLLFQNVKEPYELPGNEHVHNLLTRALIGGLSCIFCRYSLTGKTYIKPYDYSNPLPTRKLKGFDCNSLYLHSIGLDQPSGMYIYRTIDSTGKYLKNVGGVKYTKEIQWLLILQKELGIEIQTSISPSGQKQIGNYKVDGYYYNQRSKKHFIWEFLGCWFHAHQPSSCKMRTHNWNKNTFEETMNRLHILRSIPNFQVFHIWECDFNDFLEESLNSKPDTTRRQYLDSIIPKTIRTGCKIRVDKILDMILSKKIFGVVECSVSVNPAFRKYYDEFPPVFKHASIKLSDLSGVMYDYGRKKKLMSQPRNMLIPSMFCEGGVFISPAITWFLRENIKHNAEAIRVYDIKNFIEYIPKNSFKPFCDAVIKDRIAGDQDKAKKIWAFCAKNLGNSSYGRTITQVQRHKNVVYTKDDKTYFKKVKNPLFVKANDLGNGLTEIISNKKTISWKNPLHIGVFVYGYAKIKMLEFFYDFIKKYLLDSHYSLLQTDTDSFYFSLGKETLEECVKPQLLDEFNVEKNKWIVGEFNPREPGLFKIEWQGDGFCGLNSKTYVCLGDQMKLGLKGVQKKLECYNFAMFEKVLFSQTPQYFKNKGIKTYDNNTYTYIEEKKGIDYFYCKRKVLDDGIHTTTLDI